MKRCFMIAATYVVITAISSDKSGILRVNSEIKSFCQKNYGVSFPMTEKVSVKGKKMHPVYVWLTQKKYNHFSDNSVKWNFQKYLIDEKGQLVQVFAPGVEPLSDEIITAIKQ